MVASGVVATDDRCDVSLPAEAAMSTGFLQLARESYLPAQHPAAGEVDGEHHHDEHKRGTPCLLLKVLVRSERVPKHDERERGHRVQGIERQEWIAESREENRRCL